MPRDKTPHELQRVLQQATEAAVLSLCLQGMTKFGVTLVVHMPSVEPPPAAHPTDIPFVHYTQSAVPTTAPELLYVANYMAQCIQGKLGNVRHGGHLEN